MKRVDIRIEGGELLIVCSDTNHEFSDKEIDIVNKFLEENKMLMFAMGFENWNGVSDRLTDKLWEVKEDE